MRVIWSEPARADLRRLNDWLIDNDLPPAFAARTIGAVRDRAKFLKDFPRAGRPHRRDERVLVVIDTPYLIRYRIEEEIVQVIRVHHERENWHVEP